ncbi:phosphatidylinositol-specific phospholipase C/glycerophosphodiester phosphodiesterase family protein [Mucilaginibacter calamicampi]|uniref:Altered inheritance of mitochondria protein 6 n=1 Tax=Mucilaginibacter calamicampi TaxID=1302352 RepID=A0ABW2Z0R4_9SPHI
MQHQRLKVTFLKTIFLVLLALPPLISSAQVIPLPNAFAHNDYFHDRPLFDALDNGYTYIEADVFLKNGKLIVAHLNPFFKESRTLENLYLKPLQKRIAESSGTVYKGYNDQFTLMIDIKNNADETYAVLKKVLQQYSKILSRYQNGVFIPGPVSIVISGNKPHNAIMSETDSFAFIDADLLQSSGPISVRHIYTMASCKYSKLLNWKGDGNMPAPQKRRLTWFIAEAHKGGKKVRLWASPENKDVWRELLSCGVDLINTDKLTMLKSFLIDNASIYASAN